MCQKAIGMAFDTFLAVAPLSHQHLIKTVSPLHRERRDRRLRQRTRTKVVTGNRAFAPGKDDPGEGGEEAEDGFKDVHDL